jgi:hypothetical protein
MNYMTGVTAKSVSFKPSTTGTFLVPLAPPQHGRGERGQRLLPKKTITVS